MAGHFLFERAGRKQRFDGDALDGEIAIQTIGTPRGAARDLATLFFGLRAKKEAMATNPSIVSPFGGQLEADDAPEGGPDGVFVDDFNHVYVSLCARGWHPWLWSGHPYGVLFDLRFLGALRS